MATIVKCPSAKRNAAGMSRVAEVMAVLPRIRPGQAVQFAGHSAGAHTAVTTVNAFIGEARFRAFKAEDGKVYVTVND